MPIEKLVIKIQISEDELDVLYRGKPVTPLVAPDASHITHVQTFNLQRLFKTSSHARRQPCSQQEVWIAWNLLDSTSRHKLLGHQGDLNLICSRPSALSVHIVLCYNFAETVKRES